MVRLLAYSSVAQAGYMLVPFAVGAQDQAARAEAFGAVLIYLLLYGITNLGAFAVVTLVAHRQPDNTIAGYRGLGRRSPALAAAMSVFLLSLAGIPPLAGFYAKLVVFRAAIGPGDPGLVALAAFMAVMTVVALFYYLSIVRSMWQTEPGEAAEALPIPVPYGLAIGLSTVGVFLLGILPGLLVGLAPASTLIAGS
jgi:NADH-quinone oxidoreductase subunit N